MIRFLVLLLCFLPIVANSQQVSVTSIKETTDFIPGDDQRKDFNGDLCALVKIQVVDDITDIEGNIMGDIVNKGVEKWAYMAKGSKSMKIHLKNYLPVEITFNKYKIKSLKSNRIYQIILNAEKISDKPKLDRVEMKDKSYILCKIISVKGGFISFKQDEIEGTLKVPVKEVSKIKYVSGAVKKY